MLRNLNPEYAGSMTERYMIFRKSTESDDFRDKMQQNNRISGMLDLSICDDEEDKLYRYDISGCRSLDDVLKEKAVDGLFLEKLLADMEKIIIRGKSYMFDEDNYIIHPSAIYYSAEGSLRLCYLSGYEQNLKEQLCSLLSYFLNLIDVNDKESVYIYYTTYMLAKEDNCTFSSLIASIEKAMQSGDISGDMPEGEAQANLSDSGKAPEIKEIPAKLPGGESKAPKFGRLKRALGRLAIACVMLSFAAVLVFFILY